MEVNFKKLLPRVMQETRWGEYIEAVQSVINTIRTNKVDIIKNQYIFDEMDDETLLRTIKELGYIAVYVDGYASTTEYLKRQLLTVIPRILNKNSPSGYENYIASIYNLTALVYPLYYNNVTSLLTPYLNWKTSSEVSLTEFLLDLASPLILDTDDFLTLDLSSDIDSIKRHLLYRYSFNKIENANEHISYNSAYALWYDIEHHKRKTEVIYYEPQLEIDTSSGELTKETLYSWDSSSSGDILSKNYSDLSNGVYVNFGDGSYTENEMNLGSLSDVDNFKFQLRLDLSSGSLSSGDLTSGELYSGCDVTTLNASEIDFNKWIIQKNKLVESFSEFMVLDGSSGCLYYATFPKINFYNRMNTSVSVNINLV